ncbi:uncharacterized protein L201_000650 [Kwoniella dendrophila CBS 6074]|uniref:BTB domain-containing protein n=1 Tax=Kwoniella dendrophila CBS 6074 TaxID=1295534 RepID=A0AAX4JK58_9TREE
MNLELKSIKKPVYCNDYRSDDADITLISSDEVYFKVHNYMLKAHSVVFRELLIDTQMIKTDIHMDEVKSQDLKRFLDLIYLETVSIPYNWIETKIIIDLSLKYECFLIEERIRTRLNLQIEQEPWEIFILSSYFNDLNLAKKSLLFFGRDPNKRWFSLSTLNLFDASQPKLNYLLGLLKTINDIHQGQPPTPSSNKIPDWKKVSEKFQPLS